MLTIKSIAIENLRGYTSTKLDLSNLTILVGENNEGKSSALKMLQRLMEFQTEFWSGDRQLGDSEYNFWYPANDAKHRARRFILNVQFQDGRYARGFGLKKNDLLDLRLAIDSNGMCRLNLGPPRRNESHEIRAVEFLKKLQQEVRVIVLPPVRDAASSTFASKVTQEVKGQLWNKISHSSRSGAPKEYRLAREAIDKIREIVALHKGELRRSPDSPLASMLLASEVRVELLPKDIYDLIERSMFVYLSTGEHDLNKVLPHEVGNGLQSLIDINLTVESILKNTIVRNVILIIEEPEAFLHPSAQRQFMLFLRRSLVSQVQSAVLTTHSPIIVDESNYGEVVLVRNHKHYSPDVVATDRSSINTSLMTTGSSEIFFARTVILVEGEGDKAFFNTLLRRLKKVGDISAELSGLVFHATGGCTFYSPWLKLIRSYKRGNDHALKYLWIMDGDTASNNGERPVLRAARDCNFDLSAEDTGAIVAFGDRPWTPADRSPHSVDATNRSLNAHAGYLFACDFEWALFNGASDRTIGCIKAIMDEVGISTVGDNVALARRLGSKIGSGSGSDKAKKQPYIRAMIAERLPSHDLPPEIKRVLTRILGTAIKPDSAVQKILLNF
ncbi:MAG: AAA family ATPase [Telluria sp.]